MFGFNSSKLVEKAVKIHQEVNTSLDELNRLLTGDVPLSALKEAESTLKNVVEEQSRPFNSRDAVKVLEKVQEGTRKVADQVKLGAGILSHLEEKQKILS